MMPHVFIEEQVRRKTNTATITRERLECGRAKEKNNDHINCI
jgi:hypothetical protein